jgi:hypothetical protein
MNSGDNDQEIRELVIARLESLPDNLKISIGSDGEFSKHELIAHINDNDPIGHKVIEVQMNFLRSLKDRNFYEQVSSSNAA